MPAYPKPVMNCFGLTGIGTETGYRSGCLTLRKTGETALPVDVRTPPGLFEQAMEYHRRQAVEELARYQKERIRARTTRDVRQSGAPVFQPGSGEDPLKDLPFPIERLLADARRFES